MRTSPDQVEFYYASTDIDSIEVRHPTTAGLCMERMCVWLPIESMLRHEAGYQRNELLLGFCPRMIKNDL